MLRRTMLAVALATLLGPSARAETYGDKVKDVDVDKKTLTMLVEGKDRTFKVDDMVEVKSHAERASACGSHPKKAG